MIVVTNTSPLCYLLLCGYLEILPKLFEKVIIPQAVYDELRDKEAPAVLQDWIAQPPAWLEIRSVSTEPDAMLNQLHPGEREAIVLAERLGADLILLDEKVARQIAVERGLNVAGLLGVLDEATTRGLIDLSAAVERLQSTTFRASPRLLKSLLDRHLKL